MSFFDDVKEFHKAFNLPIGLEPHMPPRADERSLRIRLIHEEYEELLTAHMHHDVIGVADAIGDMIYVLCGMAVVYGIPLNEVYAEIQRSNMAKLGLDGKPIYREDGKVLKPEGWTPPDIEGVMYNASKA